jgi:hypothetical protein
MAELRFPAETREFSLHSVKAGSGVHSGAHSPGMKRPAHEADQSPPFSIEVNNGGAIPPLVHASSWPTHYFYSIPSLIS